MWQFSEIGQGRKYEVKGHPVEAVHEEKMPFSDVGDSFGTIQTQSKNEIDIPCTDKACTLNFSSYEKLEKHLNFGHHKFEVENQKQLSKVADNWVKRFHKSTPYSIEKQMSSLSSNMMCSTSGSKHCLKKGWRIPGRVQRQLIDTQRGFSTKYMMMAKSQETNFLLHRVKSS